MARLHTFARSGALQPDKKATHAAIKDHPTAGLTDTHVGAALN